MSDYIKREDAIRAYAETLKSDKDTKLIAEMILADVPNADVVEVVRCKDCEHHETFLFDDSKVLCWVHDTDIVVSPTDYCSYGERKDNE